MPSAKIPKSVILVSVALLFLAVSAYAIEDDFGAAKKTKSNYFTIYIASQVSEADLTRKLNIGIQEQILVGMPTEGQGSPSENGLSRMLDTLFLRVSDILDMHIYSFTGTIKVCKDHLHLKDIYSSLYNAELVQHSFYAYSLNTIYICPEYFTKEVLGHEIGHAIISRYFVVQPPIRVSEILAGFVEFQLRKSPSQ